MFNWMMAGAAGVLGLAAVAGAQEDARAREGGGPREAMGALPGPSEGASWFEAEPKPGCTAWLTPMGLDAGELRALEVAREARRDPYAAGHLLPRGAYAVTVVERGRVVPLRETLWVAVPGTYALTRLREPDGKLRVAWSVLRPGRAAEWLRLNPQTATWTPEGVLDPAVGFPLATPRYGQAPATAPRRISAKPKDNIVRPRDGADLVRIVTQESQTRPVLVVWSEATCGLCQALHPVLEEAAKRSGKSWLLVMGEGMDLERGLEAKHLGDDSPWVTDRYPTVRRFERGQFISEAPDSVVDYWITSKDARDVARWAQHDMSLADLGPPPSPA